ncbi:GIY-YIG catalytic domain-containing endonuclease [Paramecium bursaria Chlorella virus AN69C]|nr:GIY-YIG catalytic domain-containing endonuclease [Paramecium bursaria Chlorella virus AN69C]
MNNHAYFYVWTFRKTGKQYIGITTQEIQKRLRQHCDKRSGCVKLRNAIQKHGTGAFDIEYFEWCDPDDLDYIEMMLIENLGTLSPKGYNLKTGGGSYGKHNDESKKKMSEALQGEKHPNFGKHLPEETKRRISIAQKGEKSHMYRKTGKLHHNYGKQHSEESRNKMSEAHKGEKNHLFGKHLSEETKKKLSNANSGEKNHNFGKYGEYHNKSKKVYQYNLDGTFIQSFGSCGEAARHIGKRQGHISSCARNELKSAFGFKWSYTHL